MDSNNGTVKYQKVLEFSKKNPGLVALGVGFVLLIVFVIFRNQFLVEDDSALTSVDSNTPVAVDIVNGTQTTTYVCNTTNISDMSVQVSDGSNSISYRCLNSANVATPTPSNTPPPGASLTPTPIVTPGASSTPSPTGPQNGVVCGLIDVNSDNNLKIEDFVSFAGIYPNNCSDNAPTTGCGPKDTNSDGKLNVVDFSSFATRYFPATGQTCL